MGSIALVATMTMHPTGGSWEKLQQQAGLNTTIHILAIAELGLLTLGFVRRARAAGPDRPLIDAGTVAMALAAAAGVLAATLNGIVIQGLADRAITADSASEPVWRIMSTYNHMLNRALTQIFIGGASTAVLLWSLAAVRSRGAWQYLGAVGLAMAILSLFALVSGHMRHNVHDFGLFVFGFCGWTLALGLLLWRSGTVGKRVPETA